MKRAEHAYFYGGKSPRGNPHEVKPPLIEKVLDDEEFGVPVESPLGWTAVDGEWDQDDSEVAERIAKHGTV